MSHSTRSRELLIIFSRFPEPGKTKTRLISFLGATGAANLQRLMSEYIFAQCQKAVKSRFFSVEVHYAGGDHKRAREWIPSDMACVPQIDGGLGERLQEAFQRSFTNLFERVIVVGADCPSLTPEILAQGFEALETHDLVLGPAHDGGYYLIGLRASAPSLLHNITWGREEVLSQTLLNAGRLGLSSVLLEPLVDIDRPEDLAACFESIRPFSS